MNIDKEIKSILDSNEYVQKKIKILIDAKTQKEVAKVLEQVNDIAAGIAFAISSESLKGYSAMAAYQKALKDFRNRAALLLRDL